MLWKPERKLSYLSEEIGGYFRKETRYLYLGLESNHLLIGTAPALEKKHLVHKIRIVIKYNASILRIRRYLTLPEDYSNKILRFNL